MVGAGNRCQCLGHYCALRNAWEMSRSTSLPLGELRVSWRLTDCGLLGGMAVLGMLYL